LPAANAANDGVYEVLSVATGGDPDIITIDSSPTHAFAKTAFVVDAGDTSAVITKVTVTLMQAKTDGDWQVGKGATVTDITSSFADVSTGGAESLSATLTAGNTTGGSNILITSGDKIDTATGVPLIIGSAVATSVVVGASDVATNIPGWSNIGTPNAASALGDLNCYDGTRQLHWDCSVGDLVINAFGGNDVITIFADGTGTAGGTITTANASGNLVKLGKDAAIGMVEVYSGAAINARMHGTGYFRAGTSTIPGSPTLGIGDIIGHDGTRSMFYDASLNILALNGVTNAQFNTEAGLTVNAGTFCNIIGGDGTSGGAVQLVGGDGTTGAGGLIRLETGSTTAGTADSGILYLRTGSSFGGSVGDIRLQTGGINTRWSIDGGGGHLAAGVDSTYDIGSVDGGTTLLRPGRLWVGTIIDVGNDAAGETARINLQGEATQPIIFASTRTNTASENGLLIQAVRGRGTWASELAVTNSDAILEILGQTRVDPTTFGSACRINFTVDSTGTVSATSLPGRITFATSTDEVKTTSPKWSINNAGHFAAGTDNSWDIGSEDGGTTPLRPRRVYVGTEVVVGSTITIGSSSISGSGATTVGTSGGDLILDPSTDIIRAVDGSSASLTLRAGTSTTAADAGALTLEGGANTSTGTGGSVFINGGASTSGEGGTIEIQSGTATGANACGDLSLTASGTSGTGGGGTLNITAGTSVGGIGGRIDMVAGDSGGVNQGGYIPLSAGDGGDAVASTSNAGPGGYIELNGGNGGNGATGPQTAAAGGRVDIFPGLGGNGVASVTDGATGGAVNIIAGRGGNGASGQTGGTGGATIIDAGAAGPANGGTLGAAGAITIGGTNATQINIGTGAAARAITIGNTTTTTAIDLIPGATGTVQVNSLPLPTVLSSTAGVNLDAISTDPLYTAPSGRSCVVTAVIVRLTATAPAAGDAVISVGTNGSAYDNIIASTTLTGLNVTTETYTIDVSGIAHLAVNGDGAITFNITTADTGGTTTTATVDLVGYLF
jgi:hypothetical protein